MKEITADSSLVAFCGLYCGACRKYLSGKCPGCAANEKAGWCAVRKCCLENKYSSCASCAGFKDVQDCAKHNNFIARIFGLVFNSDRRACVNRIKEAGLDKFASEMAAERKMTVKRRS